MTTEHLNELRDDMCDAWVAYCDSKDDLYDGIIIQLVRYIHEGKFSQFDELIEHASVKWDICPVFTLQLCAMVIAREIMEHGEPQRMEIGPREKAFFLIFPKAVCTMKEYSCEFIEPVDMKKALLKSKWYQEWLSLATQDV